MKNYVFLGLYLAHQADKDAGAEEKEAMEELVGKKIRNTERQLDISMVKNLAPLVSHCQVARSKKKGFLNILLRGEEGLKIKTFWDKAFLREGTRQWDPTVGKPIHKDIKLGLEEARKKGSKV